MAMTTVELQIPSRQGCEKIAMAVATECARLAGAGEETALDLATAVSEASLNAMEHAHGYDPCLPVKLTFRTSPGALEVDVVDAGSPFTLPAPEPSLQSKIQGDETARGWGLYLIRNLVHDVKVIPLLGGNLLRLTMQFPVK